MEVWWSGAAKTAEQHGISWVGFGKGRIQRGRSGDSVVNRTVLLFL